MDNFREIEVEGHRLAAVLTHPGDPHIPVFFLHGIGGSIYFWTPELTTPFHNVGPCYSLSLPGHFPAIFPRDFPADCITAELIARLISSAIQKIVGSKKVLLVGHSTGGFAALSTAIYHPEVVAGVISIAGFAKGQWTGALGLNQWLARRGTIGHTIFKSVYRLGGLHRAIFGMYWHAYVNNHSALWKCPPAKAVINCTFPHIQKLDLDTMINYFKIMPDTDITQCLPQISVPACLIAGDKDPIVPSKQSVTIAKKVNNSKLAILKGAGHLPFFERSIEYNKAIEAWLTEFRQEN